MISLLYYITIQVKLLHTVLYYDTSVIVILCEDTTVYELYLQFMRVLCSKCLDVYHTVAMFARITVNILDNVFSLFLEIASNNDNTFTVWKMLFFI